MILRLVTTRVGGRGTAVPHVQNMALKFRHGTSVSRREPHTRSLDVYQMIFSCYALNTLVRLQRHVFCARVPEFNPRNGSSHRREGDS